MQLLRDQLARRVKREAESAQRKFRQEDERIGGKIVRNSGGVERAGGFFLPRCRLCGKRLGGRCFRLRLIQGVRRSDHGLSAARAQRQQQGQGSAQYQQIFFIIFLPVFLLERLCKSEVFRFHSLLRSCRAAFRSGVLQSTGRVRWSRGQNRRCKSGRTGARPPRG